MIWWSCEIRDTKTHRGRDLAKASRRKGSKHRGHGSTFCNTSPLRITTYSNPFWWFNPRSWYLNPFCMVIIMVKPQDGMSSTADRFGDAPCPCPFLSPEPGKRWGLPGNVALNPVDYHHLVRYQVMAPILPLSHNKCHGCITVDNTAVLLLS